MGKRTDPALSGEHQRMRRVLPKPNGDPCPFCGRAMFADMPLDLDHAVPRALGGDVSTVRWAHRRCNRAAGGRLAARLRRAQTRSESGPSRSW